MSQFHKGHLPYFILLGIIRASLQYVVTGLYICGISNSHTHALFRNMIPFEICVFRKKFETNGQSTTH